MRNWNLRDLVKTVRAVAAEFPNRKYSACDDEGRQLVSCFYGEHRQFDGDPTRCIIGEALHRLGETEHPTWDKHTPSVYELLTSTPWGFCFDASAPELSWLRSVQQQQDGGTPWGMAVAAADAAFPKIC